MEIFKGKDKVEMAKAAVEVAGVGLMLIGKRLDSILMEREITRRVTLTIAEIAKAKKK